MFAGQPRLIAPQPRKTLRISYIRRFQLEVLSFLEQGSTPIAMKVFENGTGIKCKPTYQEAPEFFGGLHIGNTSRWIAMKEIFGGR